MRSYPSRLLTRNHMIEKEYQINKYEDVKPPRYILHHHDFYEIYCLVKGNVIYQVENNTYNLRAGDIMLIRPLELHQAIVADGTEYERFILFIRKEYLRALSTQNTNLDSCFNIGNGIQMHNLLRIDSTNKEAMLNIFFKLLLTYGDTGYGTDILSRTLLEELMVHINTYYLNNKNQKFEMDIHSDRKLTNGILNYINEHYHNDISLETMADKFFVNKYYMCHKFKESIGISIYQYVLKKRMSIARGLIEDGGMPTDIYRKCGFNDYTNFYRAFKKEYGISPKNLLKETGVEA